MKTTYPILLMVTLLVCSVNPPALAATIEEIERLPFDDAYRLWFQEQEAMVQTLKSYNVIHSGTTDPKTGKFTPTRFLGAHVSDWARCPCSGIVPRECTRHQ